MLAICNLARIRKFAAYHENPWHRLATQPSLLSVPFYLAFTGLGLLMLAGYHIRPIALLFYLYLSRAKQLTPSGWNGYTSLIVFLNLLVAVTADVSDGSIAYDYLLLLSKWKVIHVYQNAFLAKILNHRWRNGSALRYILAGPFSRFQRWIIPLWLSRLGCYTTLAVEAAAPLMFWQSPASPWQGPASPWQSPASPWQSPASPWQTFRLPVVTLLGLTHLGMGLAMPSVWLFQLTMWTMLTAFLKGPNVNLIDQGLPNGDTFEHLEYWFFAVFLVISIFHTSVSHKLKFKAKVARFYLPILKLLRIDDYGGYGMFSRVDFKYRMNITAQVFDHQGHQIGKEQFDADYHTYKVFGEVKTAADFNRKSYPRLYRQLLANHFLKRWQGVLRGQHAPFLNGEARGRIEFTISDQRLNPTVIDSNPGLMKIDDSLLTCHQQRFTLAVRNNIARSS